MIGNLRSLYLHRELLWIWTMRNIKIRYKQSFIGGLWAILQPLSLMIVFSIIFTIFLKVSSTDVPYPIFSYTALLPWTFFATSLNFGMTSLVNNFNLVTKVYFPREILPLAAVFAGLLDFFVAVSVFIGMLLIYRISLNITIVLVPLILTIQIFFTLGIVLLISAFNVFYRDFQFVIPVGIQIWMYITPIIYPVSAVPERFRSLYMLNPMAGIIEAYRAVVLRGTWPDWAYLATASFISILLFIVGYGYFKHVEWQFADLI